MIFYKRNRVFSHLQLLIGYLSFIVRQSFHSSQHILAFALSWPLLPYLGSHCLILSIIALLWLLLLILVIILDRLYFVYERICLQCLCLIVELVCKYHFACWKLILSLPASIMEHDFYYRPIYWNSVSFITLIIPATLWNLVFLPI